MVSACCGIWSRPTCCGIRIGRLHSCVRYDLLSNVFIKLRQIIIKLFIISQGENFGPDIFYVEEAQETLKHIRKIGISMLAEKWINANAKPEVITPQKESAFSKIPSTIAENFVGFIKTNQSKLSVNVTSSTIKPAHDGINIAKNRGSEEARHELACTVFIL